MTGNEYQKAAHGFCTPGANSWTYALHGLVEEVGEVSGKFAKYERMNIVAPRPAKKLRMKERERRFGLFSTPVLRDADRAFLSGLSKELGDVCWMLAELCTQYGLRLDRVMERNIRKLDDRKARGVIVGEGDDR